MRLVATAISKWATRGVRALTGFAHTVPFFLLLCLSALGCLLIVLPRSGARALDDAAVVSNRLLGRGMNITGLEAPKEGEWGDTVKQEYFEAISDAGFNSVRLPIRWSNHAAATEPFRISPEFFARIDAAIQQAFSRNLSVVIDIHDFDELYEDPDKEMPRLLALWDQIAVHYRDFPDRLFFELLNEPFHSLTDDKWQAMLPEVLRVVRKSNPDRMIIVGPGHWNSFDHLDNLHLPDNDRRLIATFHYYLPMAFTHQEAPWIGGSAAWKGTTWTDTPAQQETLSRNFADVAAWADKNQRPMYLGEFGAYRAGDMDSRARWTAAVVREAEKRGFSWSYWECCSIHFGAYDAPTRSWRPPLLQALMPRR